MPITNFFIWIAAFATVASLYVPTLFGFPSSASTPLFAAVIAFCLAMLALCGFPNFPIAPASWPIRGLSVLCLTLAITGFAISTVIGGFSREFSLKDWGLLGLQAGTPILIALNSRRTQFLDALGWICVFFSTADLAANVILALQGEWQRDVARQSGWEVRDNQDGDLGSRRTY